MALGFNVVLAPPTARTRRRGTLLLDVIRPLPPIEQVSVGGVADRDVSQRWRMGLRFQPWPRDQWATLAEDPCVDHVKDDALAFESEVTADPFTAYKAVICSTLSANFEEFRGLLAADAQLNASDILATHLMNPAATLNLPDAAVAHTAGEHSPARSVGIIDDALDLALGGAQGLVLMDPQTAATAGDSIEDTDGDGNYYTRSGHRVVIHSQFRTLATADGGGALGIDDGMVYGLGDLFGTVTEAVFFDDGAGQLLDIRENLGEVRAEVFGIVAFESDTVFWQRVTLPA